MLVQAFVLFNVYFPAASCDSDERHDYKQQFHAAFELRCRALLATGRNIVIVGDVNIAHRAIDHCDPAGSVVRFPLRHAHTLCVMIPSALLHYVAHTNHNLNANIFGSTLCCLCIFSPFV